MPNPLLPIANAVVGVGTGTMISERALMTPKAIGLFYVGIAKTCYTSTGSKRIACAVAALACGTALIPGPRSFYRCLCCRLSRR